jgi:ABC-type transport system substrate-binding protein
MKKFQLAATLMLTAVILFSMAATAFAASNDDVITALKDAKIPETYIIQAENYLKTRELTSDEVGAVITQINKAAAVMDEAGTKDVTKLSSENKQEILAIVADAGEAVGVTVSIKKSSNGTYTVIGTDASGKEVANFTAKEVKQTGIDYTVLLLGAALILAAIGSTVVVKRQVSVARAA